MDSKQPFFSICIPNYNYAHYIGETIESVLSQTFQDFEIVIQDNASTDNSWEVIQDYAKKDSRVKIFRNISNIGFAPNLNAVTKKATGKFYILLSSDDFMSQGALECYYKEILEQDNHDKLIVCSNTIIIDENGQEFGIIHKPIGENAQETVYTSNLVKYKNLNEVEKYEGLPLQADGLKGFMALGIFCATCYSAELYKLANGYDEGYYFCPDFGFLQRILIHNPDYLWLQKPLFKYRIHRYNQLQTQKKSLNFLLEIDGFRTLKFLHNAIKLHKYIPFDTIVKVYLNKICITNSLSLTLRNKYLNALRPLMWGLALYPTHMFSLKKFYLAFFLILFFPITFVLGFFYKRLVKVSLK
jgi:glycosyltransferase involved in cell wall biosynthesis